ncbi:bacteriocin-like protein [Chryseobacterium sp. MIQD13]|uniref:bacteriocin-like protein n=1 Tax=Chryseobacterium sp. MIQD13 TaxID=3422310 RepID=UPI003D270D4E
MKNIKKLSRENLKQINGGGVRDQPIISPDGTLYCLPSQGQLCSVGCTATCVQGPCHLEACFDVNP